MVAQCQQVSQETVVLLVMWRGGGQSLNKVAGVVGGEWAVGGGWHLMGGTWIALYV